MAHEVLVIAHAPEPAGTLSRLVGGAGGTAVVVDAVPERLPDDAALVVAQWPLEGAAEPVVAPGGVGLVLVCAGEPGPEVWRDAVRLGAETVAVLPEAEPWLAARVAHAVRRADRAPVLAVVGGCGGAGATTLAAALALTAARRDLAVTLLDLDPLGGGVDLLFGAEAAPGLRWQDLRNAPGRLAAGAVRSTAPSACDVSLLTWDRSDEPRVAPAAVRAALESAVDDADLVVADLPRRLDDAARTVLADARAVLVVVRADVRAAAAAVRVVAQLERFTGDLAVVVRGPAPTGLPAETVADTLGLPLAGDLRPEPGLAAALDRGDVPPVRARGPLAALSARLLVSALER
ncbi:MAG TPA: septum site-determining protein Ssd [Kineosporiaceae bacterium]|nr:septum site-determining protein Ssd [Kineosporiaceae bacterium]